MSVASVGDADETLVRQETTEERDVASDVEKEQQETGA